MGYLVNGNHQTKYKVSDCFNYSVNNGYGNCYGRYRFGDMLMQNLPGMILAGIEKFAPEETSSKGKDKSTGKDSSTGSDKSTGKDNSQVQEKINALNNELNTVVQKAGVSSYKDLTDKIATENVNLNQYNQDIKIYGTSQDIQTKLNACYTTDEHGSQVLAEGITQDYVNTLNTQLEKAIELETKKIPEQQRLISELLSVQGEADNIYDEIAILEQKKTESDFNYSIEQEKNDIRNFMDALKNFKANQTKETATALYNAYQHNDSNKESGIQNKTVVSAYEMVQKQVVALIKQ